MKIMVSACLPTPRTSCEIVNRIITDKDGVNRDREFRKGAEVCYKDYMRIAVIGYDNELRFYEQCVFA